MGYFKDTVKGIYWIGGLRGVTRVITYIRIGILARILTPTQFGVFGVATLILSFVEILTETGINVFLIQENEGGEKYLNTAWIVSIIRGIIISLFIVLTASFVSEFFNSSESYMLLLLISIVPFIRGFINPSVVKFQKNLEFHKEFYFRSFLFFIEALVSIVFAFSTQSASSFVFGLIASAFAEVLLSFLIIRPIPVFSFKLDLFKNIFRRGKWVTLSGVFNYLFYNGDNIVIGRLLGTYSLGLYQNGYKISTLPITEISDVISKVTFPVYVKIAGDLKRLKKAFLKTTFYVFLSSFVFGLILFIFPEQIVRIILGDNWLQIVPVLKVLAVFGVIRAISGSASALFLAVKKQNYVTFITFISALGLLIPIVPLVNRYGIIGAGYSALTGSVIGALTILYFLIRLFSNEKS